MILDAVWNLRTARGLLPVAAALAVLLAVAFAGLVTERAVGKLAGGS